MAVVAIVVVGGVDVGAVEVGVVGVGAIVDCTGPIVAVVPAIVQRTAVDVSSANEEQSSQAFRVSRYLPYRIKGVWTLGSESIGHSDY